MLTYVSVCVLYVEADVTNCSPMYTYEADITKCQPMYLSVFQTEKWSCCQHPLIKQLLYGGGMGRTYVIYMESYVTYIQ